MTRSVLLVGSVPLRPAAAVFEVVAEELGELVERVPDGDQHGWILGAQATFDKNPALELSRHVPISAGGVDVPIYRLRQGLSAADLRLGPYGYADVAADSYAAFKQLREQGVIPEGVRFQVTMLGPGTSAFMIDLPAEKLLPIARAALEQEIDAIVANVPAHDLTIQLDIAMEAEHEEYRRRPDDFDTPVHEEFDWTLEQMAESAAWVANRVPADAELGFHICSIWHHYQAGGQDNAVLVDTVNAIADRVERPIGYFHMPTIPEHDVEDFAPLRNLRLGDGTRLYLGVIHKHDGIDGARRRIAAAQSAVDDFGIASFCGLGLPAVAEAQTGGLTVGEALHEDLRVLSAPGVRETLALHRSAATFD
jgi:hypothetical protein